MRRASGRSRMSPWIASRSSSASSCTLTDDAMSGRATDSSGTARQFTGWLGLLGAIDALVPGGPPVSADAVARGSREHGGVDVKRAVLVLVCALGAFAPPAAATPARPLSATDVARIDAFTSVFPFNEGRWGILATDLETGRAALQPQPRSALPHRLDHEELHGGGGAGRARAGPALPHAAAASRPGPGPARVGRSHDGRPGAAERARRLHRLRPHGCERGSRRGDPDPPGPAGRPEDAGAQGAPQRHPPRARRGDRRPALACAGDRRRGRVADDRQRQRDRRDAVPDPARTARAGADAPGDRRL